MKENNEDKSKDDIQFGTLGSIPIWKRYVLSISEAAAYYHIGEKKIRNIVDLHPEADFLIMNGNRVLLKKSKFENFLDELSVL
ncbi:MAG: transposase [Clostridia bacterium]|nr:transposase [Clostridia bacterium]NCC44963.1 transposase [Clostridia bacterium]